MTHLDGPPLHPDPAVALLQAGYPVLLAPVTLIRTPCGASILD
jgi:hypothetical protein